MPILALTADAVSGVEHKCAEAGMDGYLTKPIQMQKLEDALLKYLPHFWAFEGYGLGCGSGNAGTGGARSTGNLSAS